jgi:hypothetical protein
MALLACVGVDGEDFRELLAIEVAGTAATRTGDRPAAGGEEGVEA